MIATTIQVRSSHPTMSFNNVASYKVSAGGLAVDRPGCAPPSAGKTEEVGAQPPSGSRNALAIDRLHP